MAFSITIKSVVMLSVIMLSHAECRDAECRGAMLLTRLGSNLECSLQASIFNLV